MTNQDRETLYHEIFIKYNKLYGNRHKPNKVIEGYFKLLNENFHIIPDGILKPMVDGFIKIIESEEKDSLKWIAETAIGNLPIETRISHTDEIILNGEEGKFSFKVEKEIKPDPRDFKAVSSPRLLIRQQDTSQEDTVVNFSTNPDSLYNLGFWFLKQGILAEDYHTYGKTQTLTTFVDDNI